jgi:hypothetical protein
VLDQDQHDMQRSKDSDGDHDVLQSNIKEQSLFYGDIPDDGSID